MSDLGRLGQLEEEDRICSTSNLPRRRCLDRTRCIAPSIGIVVSLSSIHLAVNITEIHGGVEIHVPRWPRRGGSVLARGERRRLINHLLLLRCTKHILRHLIVICCVAEVGVERLGVCHGSNTMSKAEGRQAEDENNS